MNMKHTFGLLILAVCTMLTLGAAVNDDPPSIPPTPAPVLELVSVRPFTLDKGYTHFWRKEQPKVDSGYLFVLKVDPDLVYPRQTAEPVLYVGNQTAERVNLGYESGHVVAIVPAVLDDPKHEQYLDLTKALIWFGTPELPERVTAKRIAQEKVWAQRAGIVPVSEEMLEEAVAKDGPALDAEDKLELLRESATLVETYAPDEEELIERLVQPRPAAKKK